MSSTSGKQLFTSSPVRHQQTGHLQATKHCRACNQAVDLAHSVYVCDRKRKREQQRQIDKQNSINDFVHKNNLNRRPAVPPTPTVSPLSKQRIQAELHSCREILGLNYTPVTPIHSQPGNHSSSTEKSTRNKTTSGRSNQKPKILPAPTYSIHLDASKAIIRAHKLKARNHELFGL